MFFQIDSSRFQALPPQAKILELAWQIGNQAGLEYVHIPLTPRRNGSDLVQEVIS